MQKDGTKKSEKIDFENIKNKLNSQNDTHTLSLKSIFDNIKNLQKYYNNHNTTKEKNLKEKINSYFNQIFSSINLIIDEKDKMISKYESILKVNEQKIRFLYSEIFNLKIKNNFLESNIDVLLKKEKEYRLVKEKTGVVVENGVIVYNNRKENEIFILRTENSTLKNVINKNEKEICEIKEKLKNEIENYDKKISNLNNKINQLKYKLKQSDRKTKGQSFSSINLNNNENSNNLKLNLTVNNSLNKVYNKGKINGVSIYNNDMNNNKNSNNNIKNKYESILLNKNIRKSENNIINSDIKSVSFAFANRSSSGQLKLKNKVIKKSKKIIQDETTPNTFHNELNLTNINVSPIHAKKILCLTPQNNNDNPGVNFQTFQKITDKGKLKIIHNNCKIIKNYQTHRNMNNSNNINEFKVLYKNKSKTKSTKNNNNIKNIEKKIKKELTWSNNLLINNSAIPSANYKLNKKRKIISNNNKNNIEINKTNNTRSPQNNLGKNQRKRNLIGNIVGKDHVMTNKMSLSSIRKKNTTNTSNNSNNKYIFN